MPGLYKDEAVVLRSIKLGEADRIVTLYTREHGKVRAVVKGVRKTKSRFGARLEPFTRVDVMLYRGRGELDTVTAADVVDGFDPIRRDFDLLAAASVLVEVIERITPDREGSTSTFDLLSGGLTALANRRGDSVLPAFLMKLLSLSGFYPEVRVCSGCGRAATLGGFSVALGGAVCRDCWSEDHGAIGLAPDRFAAMSRLLREDFGEVAAPDVLADITNVLRHYTEYVLERPLRSFAFLTPQAV